jgi:hypothetical protein
MLIVMAALAAAVYFGLVSVTIALLLGAVLFLFWDDILGFLGILKLSPIDQKVRSGSALANLVPTLSSTPSTQPQAYRAAPSCGCSGKTCTC